VSPNASGPPAHVPVADNGSPRPRVAALKSLVSEGGERAFQAFVRRSDDARLERTAGSARGLRLLFGAMAHAYVPEGAGGFAGELEYRLRRSSGRVASWTLAIDGDHAIARPGPASAPALTLKLSVADFVRMAGRDLDPGKALLVGRLDLEGDFALAARLGEMFGAPAGL